MQSRLYIRNAGKQYKSAKDPYIVVDDSECKRFHSVF